MRYYRRNDEENVSLLEFLRTHDTSKASCPFYKHQKCLVGIKYVSYFNPDFFFQFLLINHPHRNLDDLKHPNHETLAHDLTYFASCLVNIPHLLSEEFICEMLQKEGHKSYFIDNVVNFIHNTRNVYQLLLNKPSSQKPRRSQLLLINHPHRNLDDLKHPNHETLAHDLTYFASCLVNIPHLLSEEFIREMLQKEGHKFYFIDNVVNFIHNTRNVYQLWQIQILRNDDFLSL